MICMACGESGLKGPHQCVSVVPGELRLIVSSLRAAAEKAGETGDVIDERIADQIEAALLRRLRTAGRAGGAGGEGGT